MCLNKVLMLDLKKNKSAEVWPRGRVRLVNSCLGYLVAYPKMSHTDTGPTRSLTTPPSYSPACIRISQIHHLPLFRALLPPPWHHFAAHRRCTSAPARPQGSYHPVPSAASSTTRSPPSASLLAASPFREEEKEAPRGLPPPVGGSGSI